MPIRRAALFGVLAVALLLGAGMNAAHAQRTGQHRAEYEGVGIDRKHGDAVPHDLTFTDHTGQEVTLGQYFDGERPVLLNLVYHDCPMLCGLLLNGVTETIGNLSWTPGDEYTVLTVSFNPRESFEQAAAQRERYLSQLDRPAAADGWHFLTGDAENIDALTDAVGFNVRWIESKQEFAHPTTYVFLSGEGMVSQYIHGMQLPKDDTRQALVEASDGQVGSVVDLVMLYCFQFDPDANTYTADAFNLMKAASALTVLILGGMLYLFWRRENEHVDEQLEGRFSMPSNT
jgi:protein SCO1/2